MMTDIYIKKFLKKLREFDHTLYSFNKTHY
jgi:hypothetical protein